MCLIVSLHAAAFATGMNTISLSENDGGLTRNHKSEDGQGCSIYYICTKWKMKMWDSNAVEKSCLFDQLSFVAFTLFMPGV